MYMTTLGSGILKAEMDGTKPSVIINDQCNPAGLTVDWISLQLYWACLNPSEIESATLGGQNHRTVQSLQSSSNPHGIVTYNDYIYWGNYGSKSLQSRAKNGSSIRTHYVGSESINHMVVVPPYQKPAAGRVNPCKGATCDFCVLTSTGHSCLKPTNY